MQVLISSQRYS